MSLAYRVLRDEERRRIYDTCGWEGLVKAEQFSEVSVFDEDAFEQYESFFSGEDEDDRQYLLIHGEKKHFEVAAMMRGCLDGALTCRSCFELLHESPPVE